MELRLLVMERTSARPPERESAGGKQEEYIFLVLNPSCPEYTRILRGSSKERSLRVAPQVGQGKGCQGSGSVLGKGTLKRKIDSMKGRFIYNRRLGTAEPVFGDICSAIGLSRFTFRGKRKVNIQWLLYWW